MQNKGAITLLTIALALVSLYQLSFTWKTNRVEKVAREYAQGDGCGHCPACKLRREGLEKYLKQLSIERNYRFA